MYRRCVYAELNWTTRVCLGGGGSCNITESVSVCSKFLMLEANQDSLVTHRQEPDNAMHSQNWVFGAKLRHMSWKRCNIAVCVYVCARSAACFIRIKIVLLPIGKRPTTRCIHSVLFWRESIIKQAGSKVCLTGGEVQHQKLCPMLIDGGEACNGIWLSHFRL